MDTKSLSVIIEAALLQGATRAVVEAELAKVAEDSKAPMPSQADVDAAYAACVERWITDAEQNDGAVYAYHVRVRKHLYQRSYQVNDFKTCLAIAADLAKLQRQYVKEHAQRQPQTTEQTDNIGPSW